MLLFPIMMIGATLVFKHMGDQHRAQVQEYRHAMEAQGFHRVCRSTCWQPIFMFAGENVPCQCEWVKE